MSAPAPSSASPAASTSSGTRAASSTRRRSADPQTAATAMAIEARAPPSQFVFRLQRTLGGRAGWNGFAFQILFVIALVWIVFEIIANARINLATQRITSGFGFLDQTAGFDVSQSLIAYSGSSS